MASEKAGRKTLYEPFADCIICVTISLLYDYVKTLRNPNRHTTVFTVMLISYYF